MYNIIKDNAIIATVDRLSFWKRQRNGININCAERDANGVIVGDAFYHLPWMPQSGGGEETVTYEEFSGASAIEELDSALLDAEYNNIIGGIE